MTRDNALFLSTAATLNQQQLMTVFDWFQSRLRVLGDGPWRDKQARHGYVTVGSFTMRTAAENPVFKEKISRFLRMADLGIESFEVEFRRIDENDVPEDMPDALRKELLDKARNIEVGSVRTCHRDSSGQPVWFDLDDESDGTRNLFELVGPWIDTIESGYVLFADEVFSNLHPLLTRELLTRFHAASTDESSAQVVMTTHETSLLDREVLRRDQVWLIEKDRHGASRLYPLLDYKPRSDEALQRGYLMGRYGSLPYLGELD